MCGLVTKIYRQDECRVKGRDSVVVQIQDEGNGNADVKKRRMTSRLCGNYNESRTMNIKEATEGSERRHDGGRRAIRVHVR